MSNTATYPLRLPISLKNEVSKLAKEDGTSMNQFIAIAIAEKVAAIETAHFFAERAKKANLKAFEKILARKGGKPPQAGDELD